MEFPKVFVDFINSSIRLHSFNQFTETECAYFGAATREPANKRSRRKGPRFLSIDFEKWDHEE